MWRSTSPDDLFYDFETYEPLRGTGATQTFDDTPLNKIPVHIKSGAIIPLRANPTNTTTELRKQDFRLLVAPNLDGTATGYLYLDDGEALEPGEDVSYINFSYSDATLSSSGTFGYQTINMVRAVVLLGGDGSMNGTVMASLVEPFEIDLSGGRSGSRGRSAQEGLCKGTPT